MDLQPCREISSPRKAVLTRVASPSIAETRERSAASALGPSTRNTSYPLLLAVMGQALNGGPVSLCSELCLPSPCCGPFCSLLRAEAPALCSSSSSPSFRWAAHCILGNSVSADALQARPRPADAITNPTLMASSQTHTEPYEWPCLRFIATPGSEDPRQSQNRKSPLSPGRQPSCLSPRSQDP